MKSNIDLVYQHYIKPLSYKERLIIVRRIMQDFMKENEEEINSTIDRMSMLRKFKGIAGVNHSVINEEEWYKQ